MKEILSHQNQFIKELYKKSRMNNGEIIILNFFKSINEYGELKFNYLLCTKDWYDKNKINPIYFKEIIIVSKEIIDKLSFVKTNSEVLGVSSYKYGEIDKNANNIVILEHISDPNNLASIIRTCVAFNLCNIYITKDSVSPYNEKVLRGTVGSFIFAKIKIIHNIKDELENLKKKDFKIIATTLNRNSKTLSTYKFIKQNKYAIIFGNEAKGISDDVIKNAHESIFINMFNIDSLNVASAAAIVLYNLMEKK